MLWWKSYEYYRGYGKMTDTQYHLISNVIALCFQGLVCVAIITLLITLIVILFRD